MKFGLVLIQKETIQEECDVCLEAKNLFVKSPNCSHWLCRTCFSKIYFEPNCCGGDHEATLTDNDDIEVEEEYESDEEEEWRGSCPLCRSRPQQPWKMHL